MLLLCEWLRIIAVLLCSVWTWFQACCVMLSWCAAAAEVKQLAVMVDRGSGRLSVWFDTWVAPSFCRPCWEPRGPGQARQLPGSLLGYGSGPPTRSHVTPSVPPRTVPNPALPSTTQRCQTRLGAGGSTVSPRADTLLVWCNSASAEAKK